MDIDLAVQEIEAVADKKFNAKQREFWMEMLNGYSESVLLAGWNDFIATITPNYLPSGKKAMDVFSQVQLHNEFKPSPEQDEETKRYGIQQIGEILKFLKEKQR